MGGEAVSRIPLGIAGIFSSCHSASSQIRRRIARSGGRPNGAESEQPIAKRSLWSIHSTLSRIAKNDRAHLHPGPTITVNDIDPYFEGLTRLPLYREFAAECMKLADTTPSPEKRETGAADRDE